MKEPALQIINPQLIADIRKCQRTTAVTGRHEGMPANNGLSIGRFKRTSEEILNCSTAHEPARQKPIVVGEHAGKLSNSQALVSRCDQCRQGIDSCWRVCIDCFRVTQASQSAGAGFVSESGLLLNMPVQLLTGRGCWSVFLNAC